MKPKNCGGWLLGAAALCGVCCSAAGSQGDAASAPAADRKSTETSPRTVVLPYQVAVLVQPILDEQQRMVSGQSYNERLMGRLLYQLTRMKGSSSDEALVVLMCFYIGESQEELDEVIDRGQRMFPYLKKYRLRKPLIPERQYTGSLYKERHNKQEAFEAAEGAISGRFERKP
jgi:hypothetical protein